MSKRILIFSVFFALLFVSDKGAHAATYNIPNNSNIFVTTGFAPPANGDVWNLLGNSALFGGLTNPTAVTLPSGGSLSINGLASGPSTVTMNSGGGIFTYFGGATSNLNLSNVIFTGGSQPLGGVANLTGTLTINASGLVAFNNNTATSSANPFISGGGAISGDRIQISGAVSFSDNQAASDSGGAMAASTHIEVIGAVNALRNIAGGNGGAFVSLGDIVLGTAGADSTISNNTAGGSGGGLFAEQDITVNGNLTTNNNIAGGNGGAIYSTDGSLQITGEVAAAGNRAGAHGGAFYTNSGAVRVDGNLAMTNNSAGGNGGAIYARGGSIILTGDATLSANTARNGNGGALDAASGAVVLGNGGLSTLSDNTASGSGGGIYSARSVTVNGDITANNNSATTGAGGAINAASGDVTINGTLAAAANTAALAGGAVQALSGNVTVASTALLSRNTAQGGNGGGINAAAGGISIGGGSSTISNNGATGNGGGLFAAQGITIDSPLTASVNTAGLGGGALYAGAGNVSVAGDALLAANIAQNGNGGAINAVAGAVTLGGGGISTIVQNSAAGNGGGIFAAQSFTMNGALTVNNNNASGSGGGIFTGQSAMINGAFNANDNNASGSGGGVFAGQSATVNGAFNANNNSATTDDGGVIRAGTTVTLNIDGASTISNNTAGGNGGAVWSGEGATVTSTNGNVLFSGNHATGLGGAIYADAGSVSLNATGGDITFGGNTQSASGTTNHVNSVYMANSSGAGSLLLHASAGSAITFFDPVATDNSKGLFPVTKNGAGAVSFNGLNYAAPASPLAPIDRWTSLYATTQVNEGVFEVSNNAIYGTTAALAGQPAPTSFTVIPGAVLQGGVAGTVAADSINLGGTLNVAGLRTDLRGAFVLHGDVVNFGPDSRVLFNTELNDGTVQNSDRLVLSRAATTGTASILVTNIGGNGGLTRGNGILLVQTENGATTTPTAFTLGSRVAAGAYEYHLARGGRAGDSPNNWYLRNIRETNIPEIPGGPEVPEIPAIPDVPGLPEIPGIPSVPDIPVGPDQGPVLPDFRVEVPVYMAVPALAQRMGTNMLGTYHDRVGEDRPEGGSPSANAQSTAADGTTEGKSVWGRLFGEIGSVDYQHNGRRFTANGPSYDFAVSGMQVGMDLLRARNDNGSRDIAGLYMGFMRGNADVESVYSSAKAGWVTMNGYTLGGYWTHKGASEWYVDAVLQGTRYADVTAESKTGPQIQPDGWGVAASLETGYPIAFGEGWALEPQAQILYQWISLDGAADVFGRVQYADMNVWQGRVGARLSKDWTTGGGGRWSAWARANLWYSFDAEATTTFSSPEGRGPVDLHTKLAGTWGQFGLGLSGQLADRLTVYITGDYNQALDKGDGHSVGGRIGLRYEF